jgi:hypothetical protein
MTGKETTVLERIEGKVDQLMQFMFTYTEKSKHCEAKFAELEGSSKWTRGKVILILGFGGGIGFAVGVAVKLFK